jgi:hypothetical protein
MHGDMHGSSKWNSQLDDDQSGEVGDMILGKQPPPFSIIIIILLLCFETLRYRTWNTIWGNDPDEAGYYIANFAGLVDQCLFRAFLVASATLQV